MNKSIIEIKNIGKKYNITHRRGGYIALRDVLMNVIKSPFSFLKTKAKQIAGFEKKEEFWALKDVNFTVQKGEVVGIIGANGAGKSTLLKILSQITPPTEGEIVLRGRVGSLLEVGTGFHPELTGRENIFLNGAILGMKKREIAKKFDEIVEFAGIEKFLDTPVKYYSSGMYVRLAFSVAAHMEPDILLIDEVLAVGDAEFQKKCLGKMEEVTKKERRTILFVSHNMAAIKSLCSRCLLLRDGEIVKIGPTADIIDLYLDREVNKRLVREWNGESKVSGNDFIKLRKAQVICDQKAEGQSITTESPITIHFEFSNLTDNIKLHLSLVLWTLSGQCVFNLGTTPILAKKGVYSCDFYIPGNLLNDEHYSVEILFIKDGLEDLYRKADAVDFKVAEVNPTGKWMGVVRPKSEWDLKQIK